jgi:phage terminase small subunit
MKKKRTLTARQKLFVREYLVDLNATQAYIRAGYRASEAVARANSARMIANDSISAAIHEALEKRFQKLEISSENVLQEIAKSAFANIMDYMVIHKDGLASIDLSKLTREQAAAIAEIRYDDAGEKGDDGVKTVKRFKFKLLNKLSSLELLGKYLKLFNETTPAISKDVRKLLEGALDNTMTAREAAYRITLMGLPIPEILKIEVSKMQPPPEPQEIPVGMSDEELEAAYQASLLKQERETAEFLPRRRREVQDIKDELKHQDSFKPDAKTTIREN